VGCAKTVVPIGIALDGKYTGITWDQIYVDTEAGAAGPDLEDPEEDFDDIPFG
jgi:hypothetical protein